MLILQYHTGIKTSCLYFFNQFFEELFMLSYVIKSLNEQVLIQHVCTLQQYRLWSFQMGYTKLERFLPKNQPTQRKFLNFENWTNGEVSKSAKSPNLPTFKVNFLYQKLSESFSIFFSLKNFNLGACFLFSTFF